MIPIGRSPDSDVVLDYPMISWEHARIVQRNGQHILEDLNSRNGTAINELQNRIREAVILPTDDVYLASFKIPASRLLSDQGTAVGEAAYGAVEFHPRFDHHRPRSGMRAAAGQSHDLVAPRPLAADTGRNLRRRPGIAERNVRRRNPHYRPGTNQAGTRSRAGQFPFSVDGNWRSCSAARIRET